MQEPQATCPCGPAADLRRLGQADGWRQCAVCGRLLTAAAEEGEAAYPLPAKLRQLLRESYTVRQPGGGVTRAQCLIVGHDTDGESGLDWDYQGELMGVVAERTIALFLERGATRVETWLISERGLSTLTDSVHAPWALRLVEQPRERLSALAT